jgi:hypothetical protein
MSHGRGLGELGVTSRLAARKLLSVGVGKARVGLYEPSQWLRSPSASSGRRPGAVLDAGSATDRLRGCHGHVQVLLTRAGFLKHDYPIWRDLPGADGVAPDGYASPSFRRCAG